MLRDMAFSALADPVRRHILAVLAEHEECSVGQLSDHVDKVGRTAVSSHLRILRTAGLIVDRRNGRFRYYSINPTGPAQDVIRLLQDVFLQSQIEIPLAARAIPASVPRQHVPAAEADAV